MEMKIKVPLGILSLLFSTLLFADNYRRYDAPVNYSYYHVSVGTFFSDEIEEQPISAQLSMEGMLSEYWIFELSYKGSQEERSRFERDSHEITTGLKRRFNLMNAVDLSLGIHGGYAVEIDDYDFFQDHFGDYVYGGNIGINYGLTNNLETRFKYTGDYWFDELRHKVSGSINYYFSSNFGVGMDVNYDFESETIGTSLGLYF